MSYSLVGIVSLLILLITHFEIFLNRENIVKIPAIKEYRLFIIIIALYYITDILWGIFDYVQWKDASYGVTVTYFLWMSLSVFAWVRYVVRYLEQRKINRIVTYIVGILFPIFCISILIVNFFTPIFFEIVDGVYVPHTARYAFLFSLMALFIFVSIYAFVSSFNAKKKLKARYITTGVFSVLMAVAVVLQLCYPLLPIYAIGCATGIALIKSHVVNTEKNELALSLNKVNKQIEKQSVELETAMELAYNDPLTGAKSKHAYVELEESIDKSIRKGEAEDFAVIVFDVNYLKNINDALGHDVGDRYLIESCALIKEYFKYSDVYRYGGDEFIIILEGVDYAKRKELLATFREVVKKNKNQNKPVIATGLADFVKDKDHSLRSVFNRADKDMYANKKILKGQQ